MNTNELIARTIIVDEIISIEECGIEETLDIEVSGNRLFFANDILTHNSGFDTSDITMANVSESAGIVHTADFFCAIYQQEGDREANVLNGKVLKNRLGGQLSTSQKSLIAWNIDYTTLRITDQKDDEGVKADSPVESTLTELLKDVN
jgi:hypothetical protein